MFNVMWSELLMIYTIGFPLGSLVYGCKRVECVFTSPVRTECGMFVMYCQLLCSAWMCCIEELYTCLQL